ncbi:MAG TPA: hypothetical protein PKA63_08310 [Oligoflexia bacterium]|nr:hypothetical protein [Oligoflexia bacterium]HMP48653.1 hypothetical protein [Oligoflexia bacterium]
MNKMRDIIDSENCNSGSILFELALSIPILLFVSFLGYDFARSTAYELALKDVSRELAVSAQLCAFREAGSAEECLREHIGQIEIIARSNFPRQANSTQSPVTLSFEAFELASSNDSRVDACLTIPTNVDLIANLPVRKIVGRSNNSSYSPKFTLRDEENLIRNIFGVSPQSLDYGELVCLNRTLVIAEAEFFYRPILVFKFYGSSSGSEGNQSASSGFFGSRSLRTVTIL